jgi:hypothetical protein
MGQTVTSVDRNTAQLLDRPVIVLGAPRSGTSMIFQALSAHPELWSLYRESQQVIQPVYPVRMEAGHSARVTAEEIEPGKIATLQQAFFDAAGNAEGRYGRLSRAIPMILRARLSGLTTKLGQAGKKAPIRFVEKTPENCLRVSLCEAVFPNAQYVFVTRDPRGSIASLHHGWTKESRFRTRPFPAGYRLADYDGDHWCFALIPAWEELNGAPVAEVCARQWVDTNEYALAELPQDSSRVMTVRYEDLVAKPGESLDAIAAWTGLDPEPLRRFSDGLPVVNTWTPPRDDKWRRAQEMLDSVEPVIAPMRERLGYTRD